MVPISLFASNLLDQLFPAFLLGLIPRASKRAVPLAMGIVCGVATLGYVSLGCAGDFARAFPFLPTWLSSVNVGLSALVVNVIVVATGALMTRVLLSGPDQAARPAPTSVDRSAR